MGTVIIFKGEAYVFADLGPQEAIGEFFTEWFPEADKGLQLFPIGGSQVGRIVHTISGKWSGDEDDAG